MGRSVDRICAAPDVRAHVSIEGPAGRPAGRLSPALKTLRCRSSTAWGWKPSRTEFLARHPTQTANRQGHIAVALDSSSEAVRAKWEKGRRFHPQQDLTVLKVAEETSSGVSRTLCKSVGDRIVGFLLNWTRP
jgi:hypothetical protein